MDIKDDIDERIKEKLITYNLTRFEELDDKTQKRLQEVELRIYELENNAKELIKRLKATRPNITNIISSDKVSITKKTAYNNPIIVQYIEFSKREFPDYFNEEKINKMEKKYDELKETFDKVMDNIIDYYNNEEDMALLSETIETLKKENNILKEIIAEKDRQLLNLKRNKINKVISIDTKK